MASLDSAVVHSRRRLCVRFFIFLRCWEVEERTPVCQRLQNYKKRDGLVLSLCSEFCGVNSHTYTSLLHTARSEERGGGVRVDLNLSSNEVENFQNICLFNIRMYEVLYTAVVVYSSIYFRCSTRTTSTAAAAAVVVKVAPPPMYILIWMYVCVRTIHTHITSIYLQHNVCLTWGVALWRWHDTAAAAAVVFVGAAYNTTNNYMYVVYILCMICVFSYICIIIIMCSREMKFHGWKNVTHLFPRLISEHR